MRTQYCLHATFLVIQKSICCFRPCPALTCLGYIRLRFRIKITSHQYQPPSQPQVPKTSIPKLFFRPLGKPLRFYNFLLLPFTQLLTYIYFYPLQSDVSKQLCEGQKKEVVEGKGFSEWAEEEFGNAGLGDLRLRRRLILMARDFYAKPQANIPQACQSRAGAKAAYRFLGNKESSMETILGSHY